MPALQARQVAGNRPTNRPTNQPKQFFSSTTSHHSQPTREGISRSPAACTAISTVALLGSPLLPPRGRSSTLVIGRSPRRVNMPRLDQMGLNYPTWVGRSKSTQHSTGLSSLALMGGSSWRRRQRQSSRRTRRPRREAKRSEEPRRFVLFLARGRCTPSGERESLNINYRPLVHVHLISVRPKAKKPGPGPGGLGAGGIILQRWT